MTLARLPDFWNPDLKDHFPPARFTAHGILTFSDFLMTNARHSRRFAWQLCAIALKKRRAPKDAPLFISLENLVDVVNYSAVRWIDEVHAAVRMIVPILGDRRTPVRWNSPQFHIFRNSAANRDALLDRSPRHLLLNDIFLNASTLLGCEPDHLGNLGVTREHPAPATPSTSDASGSTQHQPDHRSATDATESTQHQPN